LHYKETDFGFEYGSAKVERLCSDEGNGWATIGVETPRCGIQIYATRTGKVRIFSQEGEWSKPTANNKKRK
jgi:hypothetical protein